MDRTQRIGVAYLFLAVLIALSFVIMPLQNRAWIFLPILAFMVGSYLVIR